MSKPCRVIYMIATWFVVGMGSSMSALAEPLNSAISNKKPTQKETLSVVLTGQALIQSDIRKGWPDAIADIQPLLEGDVVFTNFESMILQADDSMTNLPPYNTGHYGPPEMLDVLAQMGFNLIATANNHGYDLFEKGVMNVIDNLNERDLVYSGTGVNVQKATEAGYLNTPKGRVALVSMATGAIREGGGATDSKAGVNELRLTGGTEMPSAEEHYHEGAEATAVHANVNELRLKSHDSETKAGTPVEEDASRILNSIREACKNADLVISYHHNHIFDENFAHLIGGISPKRYLPPNWIKDWSRRQIDAGADIVVIQGLPLVHGLEIYQGQPIFYNMGNFMFQLDVAWKHMFYEGVFKSVIAKVEFDGRKLQSIEFEPIVLTNDVHDGFERHLSGIPGLAVDSDAQLILEQLSRLSREFGTVMSIKDGKAVVNLEQSGSAK